MSTGTIAVLARQSRYIRAFQNHDAVSKEKAISLGEINDPGINDSLIFRQLVDKGVFVETENGRFYLNAAKVSEFKTRRLIAVAIALAAVAVILVIRFI